MLRNKRTFLLHNIGFGLLAISTYAGQGWIPTYFIRHFNWEIKRAGLVYGLMTIIFSCLGLFLTGRIADYLRSRGYASAAMLVGRWLAVLSIPAAVLLYTAPSAIWAMIWLAPVCALGAAPWGIAPAAIQQMMPREMRGQASAVYLFTINIIGLGIGPTSVAVCTQYVFGNDKAVQYSLLIVTVVACALAAILLHAGTKSFLRTLKHLSDWTAEQAV
jgi:MFS family permease